MFYWVPTLRQINRWLYQLEASSKKAKEEGREDAANEYSRYVEGRKKVVKDAAVDGSAISSWERQQKHAKAHEGEKAAASRKRKWVLVLTSSS
jgi:hypothetical protein